MCIALAKLLHLGVFWILYSCPIHCEFIWLLAKSCQLCNHSHFIELKSPKEPLIGLGSNDWVHALPRIAQIYNWTKFVYMWLKRLMWVFRFPDLKTQNWIRGFALMDLSSHCVSSLVAVAHFGSASRNRRVHPFLLINQCSRLWWKMLSVLFPFNICPRTSSSEKLGVKKSRETRWGIRNISSALFIKGAWRLHRWCYPVGHFERGKNWILCHGSTCWIIASSMASLPIDSC